VLRHGIERAEGFALFLAICNDRPRRSELIAILEDAVPARRIHRVAVPTGTVDLLDECLAQIGGKPEGPVMITGLEGAIAEPATSPIVASLNLRRPEWPEKLPVPVVFWVNEHLAGALPREAPDFFDWRTDTVVFLDGAIEKLKAFAPRSWYSSTNSPLTAVERMARIAELQSRLVANIDSEEPVVQKTVVGWLGEVADHMSLLGRPEEAMRLREKQLGLAEQLGFGQLYAATVGKIGEDLALQGRLVDALAYQQQAIPLFDAAGDERGVAIAEFKLARILLALGRQNEALEILTSSALPGLERLGERRETAIAHSMIATILNNRGEHDRALEILESRALPVFEELGDSHSRAATLVRIASVLQKQGRLEEALKLHDEALSIYQVLGDFQGRAFTLGKIADVHASLGDLDKAIEWRETKVLPILEAFELKPDLAFGRALLAGDLLRRGRPTDREKALQLLDLAESAFEELGLLASATEVKALIDAAKADAKRVDLTPPTAPAPPAARRPRR
jgi:tetratricopeptide (TPR) repeat protein